MFKINLLFVHSAKALLSNIILICPFVLSLLVYILAVVQAISLSHTLSLKGTKKSSFTLRLQVCFTVAVLVDDAFLKLNRVNY